MKDFDQEWTELTNEYEVTELIQINKIQSIQPYGKTGTIIKYTGDPKSYKYKNTYTEVKQRIFNTYGH